MTNIATATGNQLAELFGVHIRRVQQLADEGVIPKPVKRDNYELWPCIQGYIQFLQKKQRNDNPDANKAKTDLIISQTKLNDLKIAKEAGLILTVDDVQSVMETAFAAARAEFESADRKLKKYLDKTYAIDVNLSALQERTHATLTKLAEHAPKFGTDDAQSMDEMEASAAHPADDLGR